MKAYFSWPFGSKGHYHLPSAISPVLLDFQARRDAKEGKDFLVLHDSWNVQGKPIDRKAIAGITGLDEGVILENYEGLVSEYLPQIISTAKDISDRNIAASGKIKDKLGLLPSGIYRDGSFVSPLQFRDDSYISHKITQSRFLNLLDEGFVCWNNDAARPEFHIDMNKLLKDIPFEIHLMVNHPEKYFNIFKDFSDMISFHPTSTNTAKQLIRKIKKKNMKVGIIIKTNESPGDFEDLIPQVDKITFMGTKLGIKGAGFDEKILVKISKLKKYLKKINKQDIIIEVDGGIRKNTVPKMAKSGVDSVVAGSLIFNNNYRANSRWLHSL